MKTIFKVIPSALFIILMSMPIVGATSTSANSEADRILEAMTLYSQAVPMQQGDNQRSGLLQRAESILLEVIDGNPASLDAHRKLMGVYLQQRDYRNAIQTMQGAITLSPDDPKLFVALAILYDHQGAYEYARAILDEALALDPELQMARDYKRSIEDKIKNQNIAMESTKAHDTVKAGNH